MTRPARTAIFVAFACSALLWLWPSPARSGGPAAPTTPQTGARIELGRRIFFDAAFSEPPGTSCASCHDPARAFSGDHGSGAGVATGSRPGTLARRSTPSLYYLAYVPRFRFFNEDDDRQGVDPEPYGGFFWDGRSDSLISLVRQPLLNPREMNNRDAAQIADKLRRAPYAATFSEAFPGALDDPEKAVEALGEALASFLTSPAMAPFSSKYDDYLRGKATLTPTEAKGLTLFKDLRRVGCAKCHKLVDTSPEPQRSMFTDFGYEAVGAPRNARLPVRDEDRGLCERTDTANPTSDAHWCASFRTPSLRNVALRPGYMHNGAFTNLRDVVSFYATRTTKPTRWYPSGSAFDDTPTPYRNLINVTVVPYNRSRGDAPALSETEIDAIVAFLGTLTDRRL